MSRMDSLAGAEIKETCFSSLNKLSNFPGKLWHLVNDPEVCSVCWDASGEGILIYEEAFNAEVLMSQTRKINAYFKTTHFTSFVRQLNLYGFRKLPPNRNIPGQQLGSFDMAQLHHFCNPNFKREKPELLVRLKRLTPVNKAKLHAGIPLTSTSPKRFHRAMFISPQENSAVMREGSVLVGHQGTPYPHRRCLSPVALYTNEHVPVSELHNDVSCSHPSSSMLVQQSILPHHSQYRFYTPAYQSYQPDFLDLQVPYSIQPTASYSSYGYYPDYSAGYRKTGDITDSTKSDTRMNLDIVFKVKDEVQAAADVKEIAKM